MFMFIFLIKFFRNAATSQELAAHVSTMMRELLAATTLAIVVRSHATTRCYAAVLLVLTCACGGLFTLFLACGCWALDVIFFKQLSTRTLCTLCVAAAIAVNYYTSVHVAK